MICRSATYARGPVADILRPGRYNINLLAHDVERFPAVVIPPRSEPCGASPQRPDSTRVPGSGTEPPRTVSNSKMLPKPLVSNSDISPPGPGFGEPPSGPVNSLAQRLHEEIENGRNEERQRLREHKSSDDGQSQRAAGLRAGAR